MSKTVFAVIDCNNFFVSCERVFRPDLPTTPIVVLSNNDGCAVSRSNEAKELGIPMGAPAFKYKELFKREGVVQFSGNFSLYGDFSARVIKLIEKFTPAVEVYSIDECFVRLDGLADKDYDKQMRELRARILKWTGIPVSIGIASTKTLSKVAVEYAKRHSETSGVFSFIDKTTKQRDEVFRLIPVSDTWGIGRRYSKFLNQFGIKTIYDFTQLSHGWVLQNMKTNGVKVQQELLGQSFYPLEQEKFEWRKTITATRSFGQDVTKAHELEQALATHITRASCKLRRQQGKTSTLTIFAASSKHRRAAYTRSSAEVRLPVATNYTPSLIHEALKLLPKIYKPGIAYYRCGVLFRDITHEAQLNAFYELSQEKTIRQDSLMKSFDNLNRKWGGNTIRFAAQGIQQKWTGKSSQRSPAYTKKWESLPKVRANH